MVVIHFFAALELLSIFIVISALVWYFYYLHCFNYWKKKGVPTESPQFPAGNIRKSMLGQENLFITVADYYKKFKSQGHRHGGLYFFNGPVYLPVDPEIVKCILTSDFEHFSDRGVYSDEEKFPLSGNLFTIKGLRWRNLRNKLSPAFTSGKLKTMYEIFVKMTGIFVDVVGETAKNETEINIKFVASNFTADIIFSTAFGLESNSLTNPGNEVSKTAINFFNVKTRNFLKFLVTFGFQNPGNILRPFFDNKFFETFFTELAKNTVKHREENNIVRKDFMSLLLEIRDRDGLTFNEIVAQCFLFFLAGFETSSQTISYCIHELAYNQDIQDKLRKEIIENLGNDVRKYSYEDILKLPYLDQVFNETLRLYPVLGFFNRICVKPYKIPKTDVTIDVGTPVLIPILGMQRDPEYFSDPMKFDPERFQEDRKQVPFTFLPFGDGPRFCIGMRHGKLQTKLGIAALISQFKFLPSSKTPRYIELDKFVKSLAMVPREGVTVKVVKL